VSQRASAAAGTQPALQYVVSAVPAQQQRYTPRVLPPKTRVPAVAAQRLIDAAMARRSAAAARESVSLRYARVV